ncbi:MAG: RNA polymerase subunit sigma-70 [Kiritimatiellaceae bacterium]|nr:RNA polymerase subunit sigma-70 [Kiritimatiellaceae bacterium]RZO87402.1 MAG: sigma-70 family RNA polymerase sigma factor [Kiritimatiellaceae bacterium]|tara:strand:+ start:511 stop:1119 length:609 start_codon:yes stop_codon:yes gene_type:complete
MTDPNFQPTRVTLLQRLQSGKDQSAWLEFESTYRAFIFSLILRMGIPQEDAEDISQTVLTKVWQKIEDFEYNRNRGKFHNWLAAMTRNTVKDFFRTKKNFITGRDAVEYQESYDTIEQQILPDIEKLAREEWVLHITNLAWNNIKNDLHENKRAVFKLVSSETPNPQIAQQIGISEASVRVYKAEVFQKMRAEIDRLNNELS